VGAGGGRGGAGESSLREIIRCATEDAPRYSRPRGGRCFHRGPACTASDGKRRSKPGPCNIGRPLRDHRDPAPAATATNREPSIIDLVASPGSAKRERND